MVDDINIKKIPAKTIKLHAELVSQCDVIPTVNDLAILASMNALT